MSYQGDISEDQAFAFNFTTRTFSTGVPGTLGGVPVLTVYKDSNTTGTTTGPTLSADFSSVTGLNNVAMVTTDAFYVAGSDYAVAISTGTVGGVSVVGEVVATFSIENRGLLRATTAANTKVNVSAGGDVDAILADSASHGGTAAIITFDRLVGVSTSGDCVSATGLGTGHGFIGTGGQDTTTPGDGIAGYSPGHASAPGEGAGISAIADRGTGLMVKISNAADDATAALRTYVQAGTKPAVSIQNDGIGTATVPAVLKTSQGALQSLPGQEAPPEAPTVEQMISWLYKAFRNRKDQTATLWQLYANDETTVDSKATTSDDGTTAIKQEIVTGP